MKRTRTLMAGIAAALTLAAASAANAQPAGGPGTGGPGMGWGMERGPGMGPGMHHGMHQGMHPGMGPMGGGWGPGAGPAGDPGKYAEARLNVFKAQLGITSAQESAWQAFAGKAKQMAESRRAMWAAMQSTPQTAPDRLAQRAAMMKQRAAAVESLAGSMKDLYAVLSPEQRNLVDRVAARRGGGMGRGHGMGHGGGMGFGGGRF